MNVWEHFRVSGRLVAWAAVVLGLCWTLLGGDAAAQSPVRLQSLLNDTVAQLQLAYRHHLPEQRRRYDELAHVVAAWREAPRNDVNNRLLEDWLRGAIRSSMPGSQASLPPAPQFERPGVREMQIQDEPPTASTAEPVTPRRTEIESELPTSGKSDSIDAALENALGDPFGDDPETVD